MNTSNSLAKTLTITLFAACAAIASCKGNQTPEQSDNQQVKTLIYENEYLSFSYPSDWEVYYERHDISDNIPELKEGFSISVSPKDDDTNNASVYIVKSAMMDIYDSPEDWRDASIAMRQLDEENIYEVESTADSLHFKGERAALVQYKVHVGDKLNIYTQEQLVVLRSNMDLYYINNQFHYGDSLQRQKGKEIISSLHFK